MAILNGPAWSADLKSKKSYPELRDTLTTNVLIIGGGITGIMTAYLLAKSGHDVTLIDQNTLLSSATILTTAFLTQVIDTSIDELEDIFGPRKAKFVWQSHSEAINLIERICREEKIKCDFKRCPAYIYANSATEYEGLTTQAEVAKRLGFKVKLEKNNKLQVKNSGYLAIPNQAKFNPILFLVPLIKKINHFGGKIFEYTKAEKIESNNDRVQIKTSKGLINAKKVIIATYLPFNEPTQLFAKKGMYRSYVLEAQLPKSQLEEAIYWDSTNPYHYFRIDRGGKYDRMIIGGEDHRSEIPIEKDKNFNALEKYIQTIIPRSKYQLIRKWAGPIIEPSDGLALIGKIEKTQLVATGFSGNGMTYAAIAATIFRDLILNKHNSWISLYDPTRTPTPYQLIRKGVDYTKEFFNGAVKNFLSS